MNCLRFLAAFLMLATAITFTNFASAAEPEAERAPFRLLEHNRVFGGGLTNTKVFFGKIPDPRAAICEGRAVDKPESFESEMQLAAAIESDVAAIESDVIVERIAKQVDFDKKQVVLIAWKGHAAQSMNARVEGKGDEQTIVFSDFNSYTDAAKLAKNHVYFFVVAKDAKWKYEKEPELGGPLAPLRLELPRPLPEPGPNLPQLNGS